MAGRNRYLLFRDGRYYARLVVPKDLRPFLERKTELRTPLGADRRTALSKLPGAVAVLQHRIAIAERAAAKASGHRVEIGRYPLTVPQIASRDYLSQIEFDAELRANDRRYALAGVDYDEAHRFRDGFAGLLSDDELEELVGARVEKFRMRGHHNATKGTSEWRTIAQGLCVSTYESLLRQDERNEGDFSGTPKHPLLANAEPAADDLPPVPLKGLLIDYITSRKAVGKGREAERRWTPVFADLAKFIRHNDARRLTKQNLIDWRDERLKTLSAKTVGDVYLASVRTVLSWAVGNDRLESNVAEKVRQEVPKKSRDREKGFTLPEAVAILRKARDYVPTRTDNPRTTESPHTTAAKRWSPILCAFSGARIAEITQLRKQDFRMEGETPVMRITPAAGTVKAGGYRDVPLHSQVIDMGFMSFVEAAPDGALFHSGDKEQITAARTVAGRVSQWLQSLELIPDGLSPNHAWRHRFKTVGTELQISGRVLDAIQGHASKTAGDDYGDVTVAARKAAIESFPHYELDSKNPEKSME
ncbi:integrase [Mesorhizobium robiniae]|uniref:Integrase n=1 Tax=Mesorhizobium robiniae TaxID=559315 RepID=A0ABV2GIU9_9HYPH